MRVSDHYPVECLHPLGADFAQCIAHNAQASIDLAGPVVLSAMAAAVQGSVEIKTPFYQVIPTSLYVTVVAGSGMRKSAVVKSAYKGISQFEERFSALTTGEQSYKELGCHPFIVEDASEAGMIELFRQGARSIAMLLDEGGMLEARLDNQRMCKRFDGSAVRYLRHGKQLLIPHACMTFCMTIQEGVFQKLLGSKSGRLMVDSGLMPRMLVSFASKRPITTPRNLLDYNPETHPANERIRDHMQAYGELLSNDEKKRQLSLAPQAEEVWKDASSEWRRKNLFANKEWAGMDGFLLRAGEQAMRIAAVLQFFTEPQDLIEKAYMESAVKLVDWHLRQAQQKFATQSETTADLSPSDKLAQYLQRKFDSEMKNTFTRSDILRNGPSATRKSALLDSAINVLVKSGKLSVIKEPLSGTVLLFYPIN